MFGGGIEKAEQNSRSSLLEGTVSRSGSLQGPPENSVISGIAEMEIFHNICEAGGRGAYLLHPPNNPLLYYKLKFIFKLFTLTLYG